MDPILVLAYIAVILMAGVLCSFVSKELKLPYNLMLILLGLFLGGLYYSGRAVVSVDTGFVVGVGTLALILLVFDSSSRLKVNETTKEAVHAVNVINLFTLVSVVVVSMVTSYLFFASVTLTAVLYSLLFSVLVIETDLGSVLLLFKDFARDRARHVLLFLESEANINTAFVILLPFVVLGIMRNVDYENQSLLSALLVNFPEFLYEILIAVGIGIVIGLIFLRILKNWYDDNFSPVALVTASLVAFVFANLMGGNGIIAVAVMGFFYGNVYVSGRDQMSEFSGMFSSALEILIFVMLGMFVRLPISFVYILKTLLLFAVIVGVRVLAVMLALHRDKSFRFSEKLFIGVNMPKGLALATVILVLSTYGVFGLNVVLQLAVMMMLYSIVSSFVLDFYAEKFMHEAVRMPLSSRSGVRVLEMKSAAAIAPMPARKRRSRPARKAAVRKAALPARKAPKPAKKVISKAKKPVIQAAPRKAKTAMKKPAAKKKRR